MSPAHSKPTVLLVDDDEAMRKRLSADFSRRGWAPHTAADAEEALTLARGKTPDLAVIDLQLGTESGLDLLETLKREHLCDRVVILTGYGSVRMAVTAMQLGANTVVTKPADAEAVLAAVGARTDSNRRASLPSLDQVEWDHLQRALHEAKGSISEAARRLSLPRRTLQRKLRKAPPKR